MPEELTLDAGAPPDSSGSVATLEGADPVAEAIQATEPAVVEEKQVSETPPDEGESIPEDLKAEMEAVIEANPNDTDLVKKLRGLVKTKYDDFTSRHQPELSDAQKEQLELVNGLFDFDLEQGVATTRNFAQNLAKKDLNLAQQAFQDLSQVPMDENGFTLGHRFLESIGLDPYKIEELRQFSRGELNAAELGIVTAPPNVPKEYSEAYKSLDTVTRTDVDIYLDSENEGQKQAALRILRDRQSNIEYQRNMEQMQQRQQAQFSTEVNTAVESDLANTYSGMLSSLKQNPAYTSVAISADKNVDTMVKDSIISSLNALGDPRSVLAQQAVQMLEARGVKVDLPKIEGLMSQIEASTKKAISAERQGKLQGRDFTTQIQEALASKAQAVSQLVALGNRYFSQTLSNISGVPTNPNPKGTIPQIDGAPASTTVTPPGIKSPKDLDAFIAETARSIAASQN